MAVSIDVPTQISNVSQDIVLDGLNYTFLYKYNSRDKRLRLSIHRNNEPIIEGLKIMENQSLLSQYITPRFRGDLVCIRVKDSSLKPATLGTIGIGMEYELLYISPADLEEIQSA